MRQIKVLEHPLRVQKGCAALYGACAVPVFTIRARVQRQPLRAAMLSKNAGRREMKHFVGLSSRSSLCRLIIA